jgi:uncharacterized protein (DUF736 family)
MSIIGTFSRAKDGGWEGRIRTLSLNAKVRLVPNDNRSSSREPDFRIFVGRSELGKAWRRQSRREVGKEFLSVQLDDPSFAEVVSAALFEGNEGEGATLVWNRRS